MSLSAKAIAIAERTVVPDIIIGTGIEMLVRQSRRNLQRQPEGLGAAFAEQMTSFPVAAATADANRQHYEIPAEFFAKILGEHRKYSCCYFENDNVSLSEAEDHALRLTAEYAEIKNGQRILELGCGWGSLSLWLAGRFPESQITAVSNSNSQREFITARAQSRGLSNLHVVTADMNAFEPRESFDRVVSVEMFEHMSNWRALLQRIVGWMEADGRLYLHFFSHHTSPYRFDHMDRSDWIAQHFFTGGIMPSHDLIREFPDLVAVDSQWRWNGTHYRKTAQHWLDNYDRNSAETDVILKSVYGAEWKIWKRRWRLFFLATRGLFGHDQGREWGISHFRLRKSH